MHAYLSQGGCFAINILRLDDEDISNRFAKPGPKDFSDLRVEEAQTGAPILSDALAWLDCRLKCKQWRREITTCFWESRWPEPLAKEHRCFTTVASMIGLFLAPFERIVRSCAWRAAYGLCPLW